MKRIVIASGKGGTGKTTVSAGLQQTKNQYFNGTTTLMDFDVEEPNDHLFFDGIELKKSTAVTLPVPTIDNEKCTFCGKCKELCAFNAITLIKKAKLAEVSKELCHSCGACLHVCKYDAMREIYHPIGEINEYRHNDEVVLKEGRLEIGLPHQTAVIRDLKRNHMPATDLAIIDAPPGTSCPVVNTLESSDYVVVVAEPSPFGLNDLKLLVEVIRDIGLPFGVVINKSGTEKNQMEKYLIKEKIEIISKIPFSRDIATSYAKANIAEIASIPEMNNSLHEIWEVIKKKIA